MTASEVTSPPGSAASRSAAVRSIMSLVPHSPFPFPFPFPFPILKRERERERERERDKGLLFEDGRHAVEVAVAIGGIGQGVGDGQRRPRLVGAKDVVDGQRQCAIGSTPSVSTF